MFGAGDVRIENVPDATIKEPTDALLRITRACICGSDLWPYKSMEPTETGRRMGHEFIGVVEAVGADVHTLKPGDLVVAPFAWSDGTCVFCREGLQTSCLHGGWWGGTELDGGQGEAVRVPQADGTLVVLPVAPDDALMPGLLSLSDVMGTGHHAARGAQVGPGKTVAVVGDGAVGLCGVIAAKRLGAEQIILLGRHARPHRARSRVRRHGHRQRAGRRGGRACPRADRRPRRPLGARVRRSRPVDGDRDRDRPPRRSSRSRRRAAEPGHAVVVERVLPERHRSPAALPRLGPTSRN